jgi:hypothetical protein
MGRRRWIDADFDVVAGPYRVGEPHRNPKLRRWRFVAGPDANGVSIWYRPPRFSRTVLIVAVLLAYPAAILLLIAGFWTAHLLRSYWPG